MKQLSDWCKWLVTLEIAAIGGIFAFIPFLAKYTGGAVEAAVLSLLALSVLLLFFSIFWCAYLLFGVPEIIEQIPFFDVDSINQLKSNYLSYSLLTSQRNIFWSFVGAIIALSLAVVLFTMSFPNWEVLLEMREKIDT